MNMAKRIISAVLAAAICLTFSMSAFAGSTSKSGTTTGTSGTLNVWASLTVDPNSATATTTAGTTDGVSLTTYVTFTYIVPSTGLEHTNPTVRGTSSAYSATSTRSGYYATSQHKVEGGTRWGNWSTNLKVYA